MASFYGNIMTKNTMSNFSFDKIYSNRVAMQNAIGYIYENGEWGWNPGIDDGIFPGRYVLVEYGPQEDANTWRVGYEVKEGDKTYYCAEKDKKSTRFQCREEEKPYFIALNEYIRVKTAEGSYLFYKCKGADEKQPFYAAFEPAGDYYSNYTIDYNVYSQNYDSTVWVKQLSTTGKLSYCNVASLNTVVPSFDLTIHAPTESVQKPHWSDMNHSNVYYNLHLYNQWGLDVANENNFTWNQKGFNKEIDNTVAISDEVKDEFKFEDGASGQTYYNDSHKRYEPANDKKVLKISLPSIGNIGAEVWNKVYEVDTKTKNRKRDVDWQYKLQNPTTGEITNEAHSKDLHGKSTDTSTIAGNINKFHDLIGEIVVKDENNLIAVDKAKEDYIYKRSDGYYYISKNGTYGDPNKFVSIDLSYDYDGAYDVYTEKNNEKNSVEKPIIDLCNKLKVTIYRNSDGLIQFTNLSPYGNKELPGLEGVTLNTYTGPNGTYGLWITNKSDAWIEARSKMFFVVIATDILLGMGIEVGDVYYPGKTPGGTYTVTVPKGALFIRYMPIWLKIDPEGASFNEMILKYRRLYSNNPDDFKNIYDGKSFMEFVREIQYEMKDANSYLDAKKKTFEDGIATREKTADQDLKTYKTNLQNRLSSEDYEPGSADVALTNYKNELQNKTNEATTTLTDFTTTANNSTITIQNEVNKVTTKANSLLTQQDITSIAVGTTTGYIQISGNETQLGNVEYIDLLKVSSSFGHPEGAKGNFTFYITEIADSITSLTYYATVNNGRIIDCNCENMFVYYWDQDSYNFNVQINKNNISTVCNKFFIKVINNSSIDILTVEVPSTIRDNYASAINPTERLSLDLTRGNPQIFTGVYDITQLNIPTAAEYIDVAYIDCDETVSISDICADFYLTFIKTNGETDTCSGPIKNFGNSSGPKQGYNSGIGNCFITKAAKKSGRLTLQVYSSVAKRYAKILVKIVNHNLMNMIKIFIPTPGTVTTSEPTSFGAREPIYSPASYNLQFEKIRFNLGYSITGNEQIDFKGDDEENYYLAQGYLDKDGRFVHPATSGNFSGALIKITILAAIKSETSSDAESFVTLTGETCTIIKNGQRVFAPITLTQITQTEQTAPATLAASFTLDSNEAGYFNKLLVTGPGGTDTANCRALIEITPSGSLNY